MRDDSRGRDARMMEAVAGMGGRSTPSREVDLRLGLVPGTGGGATGMVDLVVRLCRSGRSGFVVAGTKAIEPAPAAKGLGNS